jgi:predicted enzyme related to lactoylglutathione lyase
MKPTYFDLTVKNLKEARQFFEQVLGWRFEKFPMPYDYYRITAGNPDEPGIDGGIGEIKDTPLAEGRPITQVTIPVSNLNETLAKVKENGGIILEQKTIIPGIGWYATCAEPGGLKFGVLQIDQSVE